MTHSTPSRIVIHRPELAGVEKPARPLATVIPKAATPPTVFQQAKTVLGSTTRWVRAGRPIVSDSVLADRKRICGECPNWNPVGWFGAGRCTKCGCSGIKLSWSTERCPDTPPKWFETYVDRPAEVEPSAG